MGWKESKQAFQYALPYEQVFQAAMAAVPMVPKAVLTSADVNARFITFDTPTSFTSYGENIVVGLSPPRPASLSRSPAPPRACPTSCRTAVTARRSSSTSTGCPASSRSALRRSSPPDARDATRRRSASTPVVSGLDYEAGDLSSAH